MEEAMTSSIYDRECNELITVSQHDREWSEFLGFLKKQNHHWTGNVLVDKYLVTWNNRIKVWAKHVDEATESHILGMVTSAMLVADIFPSVMKEVKEMFDTRQYVSIYKKHAPKLKRAWEYLVTTFIPMKLDIATCMVEPYGSLYLCLNPEYRTSNLLSELKKLDDVILDQLKA